MSHEEKKEDKKIIVDEDWKEQVQAEKESAQRAQEEPPAAEANEAAQTGFGALPPADFRTLISMLATQAMMSMGALPNPISGKAEIHLDQARHFIDLVGVLQEKTKGNCTPDEEKMLDGLVHELRMGFLAAKSAPLPDPPAGPDESK